MILTKRVYKNIDLFMLAARCSPVHAALNILQRVLSALTPTFTILATAGFIDTAVKIAGGQADASAILMPIVYIVLLFLYQRYIGGVMWIVNYGLENAARLKYRGEMTEHRAALNYKHIENQDTQDLIKRVSENCDVKIKDMFFNILNITGMIIQIIGFMAVLAAHVWWAVFAMIGFGAPMFWLGIKSGQRRYDADREMTKKDRRYQYIKEVLTGRETVEERFIYGYANTLNKKYMGFFEDARLFRKKAEKKNFISMKMGGIFFTLATIGICGILIVPAVNGVITIGLFTSLVSSLTALINMMSWNLSYSLSQLATGREYLKDLTRFMALEFTEEANTAPAAEPVPFESLEFRHVSFKYPGTEAFILKDMSFTIEKGRRYSVVGINGAGKTTITKLITGLYTEFEGEILINGRPISVYPQAELKSLTAVVYQDFAKYFISIGDNIALGDINGMESNRDAVEEAAELVELAETIRGLSSGYDTSLGKIKENGVDISGGEWQKTAMARAVLSPAELRILDEPTAALDPIAESRVYEHFERISKGRTTIFISHRLGSTKLADEILVVGDGRIAERGTHDALMAQGGLYAKMYASQAEWYVDYA